MPDNSGNWGKYLGLGLEVAVSVAVGALIGYWADTRLGCSPWGLLTGCLLGLASGMYTLLKVALRANKD